MKTIYRILPMLFIWQICSAQDTVKCPPAGAGGNPEICYQCALKNRNITPGIPNNNITLDTLLRGMPDDSNTYNSSTFVTVTGWVVETQDGGPEVCNCYSHDSTSSFFKLYIGQSANAWKDSILMAEITPAYRATHYISDDVVFAEKVEVSGYLMYNPNAHKFALDACKRCHTTDRKTAWEICPVTNIKVLSAEGTK